MDAWHGFHDDGALVLFAFDYGCCCRFAFFLKNVFGVWDKHVFVPMFAVHEVANPSGYALAADVFHGHAADAGENQDEFHGEFVFEAGELVGDFAVS